MEKIVCKVNRGDYKRIFAKIKGGQVTVYAGKRVSTSKINEFLQNNKEKIVRIIKKQLAKKENDLSLEKEGKVLLFGNKIDLPNKSVDQIKSVRMFCKEYLPNLKAILCEVAMKYGISFCGLSFGNAKTRWGTCDGRNNIRLNERLIMLPRHLIEYVALHELVHTIHHNHSKYFWERVCRDMPDAKKRRKELKDNYSWVLDIYR